MEFNYALLAKYLIGSLSSEEMEEVMRWRDLSAENETVFSEVLRLRLSWNTAKYADNERIDKLLYYCSSKTGAPPVFLLIIDSIKSIYSCFVNIGL